MKSMPPRVAEVIRTVAEEHSVNVDDLLSRNRQVRVVASRHEAMRRVRAMMLGVEDACCPYCGGRTLDTRRHPSFPQIGKWFDRDHNTVLKAISK